MTLQTTFGEDDTQGASREPVELPYLFLVLEAGRPAAGGAVYPLARTKAVHVGRAEERSLAQPAPSELAIGVPDGWMSRRHVKLEHVLGQWLFKDLSSSNGTRLNGERVSHGALRDGDLLEIGHSFFVFRAVLTSEDTPDAPAPPGFASLRSDLLADYGRLQRVAGSTLEVLLLGESGAGKEIAARAVHALSGRTGDFIAVNCGAVAKELLESELFGAERGAFTGATEKRLGLVRAAHKGTLFLDEVGDMPPALQVSLLRVLERREVLPVGSQRPLAVDFRLICATHKDLEAQVEDGSFRADLYARIAGFEFELWPLRSRREDLGLLIATLSTSIPNAERLTFSPDAARALLRHEWPLNVRELAKCLSLATVLARGERVELSHLPDALRRPTLQPQSTEQVASDGVSPRDRARREQLLALIDKHAGNVSHVALELGKARSQVQRWLNKYEIDAIAYRR